MNFFPLGIKLNNSLCTVVGGEEKALNKARLLAKCGTRLRVVAPDICAELQGLAADGEVICRQYRTEDCRGARLVVAASEDRALNCRVAKDARKAGILINVVDDMENSTVSFPALIDRSPMWFAIGSDGKAPLLSRWWRHELDQLIPQQLGRMASLLAAFSDRIKSLGASASRRFQEQLLKSGTLQQLLTSEPGAAAQSLEKMLKHNTVGSGGEVWLVGAGPGDPELLTVKALQLFRQADIVFYDRLVSNAILERLRRDTPRIHVGKARDCHPVPQQQINQLLIENARAGKRVLRLKGGDPFIFGRGGEELETLCDAGIPFKIIPGVSAANGCACYAGIPLTHRDYATSVQFLSGHPRDGELTLPWHSLLDEKQTLVFFMSSEGLQQICHQLIEHGRAADTPVAVISQGTTEAQQVLAGTLSELPQKIAEAPVQPPSLAIIGRVVELLNTLQWRQQSRSENISVFSSRVSAE